MKKRLKSFCMVLLTTLIVSCYSISVSQAASSQLIIVNSKYNTLNFYENNKLVKSFKCATGKSSSPTPQRKTTIVNKIKNRPYYSLGIPGGDSRNPLGKRWMGLNMYGYGTTYAIHGTNDESSIGHSVSHGCIRMHNKEVEWLYDQIKVGANVIIKNTSNSDKWIAKQYGITLNQSGWYKNNGYTYYRKSNGRNAVGWTTIRGKTYYFSSKGIMQKGLKTISGKKYYFGTDGVRKTGWQTINGNKYYFKISGSTKGQAVKGKVQINGKYYYMDSNGKMVTSKKVKIGNYYYYFANDGKMITSKKVKVGDSYYYFGTYGKMVKNKQIKIENDYYFFNSYGKMVTNREIDNYYYANNGKAYKSCTKEINGYTYTFDKEGKIIDKAKVGNKENTSVDEVE